MKPAPFDWHAPQSLDDALALLADDDDARPLAGGQSLVPMMAMRVLSPATLVDLKTGHTRRLCEDKLLAFTWHWAHDPEAFPILTTIRFVEEDRGLSTVLRIEQRAFDEEADAEEIRSLQDGWSHFLGKLETYLGQMTLV